MKKIISIITLSIFTFFLINIITPEATFARPGGGHSYKSKKSSSSSYSHDNRSNSGNSDIKRNKNNKNYGDYADFDNDGDSWLGDLFMKGLCILLLLVPAMLVVGLVYRLVLRIRKGSISSEPTTKNIARRNKNTEKAVAKIKETDPNFSKTLFLDFVVSVFSKYYALQSTKKINNLQPFINEKDFASLKRSDYKFSEIVVGAVNILEAKSKSKHQTILVEIDANYTKKFETSSGEKITMRQISNQKWLFKRKIGIISPEPEKMRELSCPSCGANAKFTDAGKCESCGTLVVSGEMQWFVATKTMSSDSFSTSGLAHYEHEAGTDLPTIVHPMLSDKSIQFTENHKLDWNTWHKNFENKVVKDYFLNFYSAWSARKLKTVRNLLTDRLYESWMFWIDSYKNEGLTNKLDDVKIEKIEFVNIDFDKFYESATVRVFASCKDYVIDKKGKVAGGSNKKARKFSEYWTFIRKNGVEKDSFDISTCPNCGAPADKMGQTGICKYCNSKISNGDFSWVLASITQDEVYKG